MATECKSCALLGATSCCISESDESVKTHTDLHARQLQLIEFTIEKPRTSPIGSDTTATPDEKPLKSDLVFTFCRDLANSFGKNCDIKCSQCKRSIRSRQSTRKKAYSLINHAGIHLNKDLYACSHCDLKFITKTGIYSHLNKIHSISSNRENYVDMTEDHQNDIMDMVKLCFGKASDRKLDVTTFGKQKRNPSNQKKSLLSNLAYDYIFKHQGDRIQCHMCPRSIPCNQQRPGNTARLIVDHARLHLDKPIFTCRLCPYFSSTLTTIAVHLEKTHSVARSQQNYKDESSEYYEDISTMLADCFDETKTSRPPTLTKDEVRARRRQNRLRNRHGSNSNLAKRKNRCADLAQKFNQSGKLQCRICREELAVATAGTTSYTNGPMQHVLSHFNKLVINCRQCPYRCITKTMIVHHVRTKHGIPVANQFIDHTDDYHSDFMDMLSKCYDWDLEPSTSTGPSQFSSGSQRDKLIIISKTHGNALKAASQVLAHDLIKMHAKEGKIICRLCDHVLPTHCQKTNNSINSAKFFYHAFSHLDRKYWPYHCKLCSHTASSSSKINSHLRNAHKDASGHGFEDMSAKFHEDIMKIIHKCYDWSIKARKIS